MRTFRTREAVRLAGVTFRQADHWCRMDLLRPSVRDGGRGRGYGRTWSEQDLVILEAVGALMNENPRAAVRSFVDVVRRSGELRGWAVGRGSDWAVTSSSETALKLAHAVGGPVWILRLGDVLDRIEAEEAVA